MKGVSSQTKNGATYWYARINGEKRYMGDGEQGRKRAEAARSKWIATKYERRDELAGLKVKRAEFKTVMDLCNWYMTLPAVQEKKAYERYLQCCAHLIEYFGKKPTTLVEADDIEHYRLWRQGQGASDGTINLEVGLLRSMYLLARRRKKIPMDTGPGEFIQKNESLPRRPITEEEFKAIYETADTCFRDVLLCGHESAMRSSEICGLRVYQVHLGVDHISEEGRTIKLDYIDLGELDTKTKERRTVPVSPKLKKVLIRHIEGKEPEDHVFTNQWGLPYTRDRITRNFMRYCEKAGVPWGDKLKNKKGERVGVVFHCLRHTRTSKWVAAGWSDEIVRRATGHKSLEAYRKYVHLDPAAVMRLVQEPEGEKTGRKPSESLATG